MAILLCEACGETLEAEDQDHLLRVYDVHVAQNHQASPAQWSEAHNRIEAGKERVKQAKNAAPTTAK